MTGAKEFIGQDEAWREWCAAVNSGRMHHAWLLSGPKGLGKRAFARAAAAELVRLPGEPAPSPINHPDIIVLDHAPKEDKEAAKRAEGKAYETKRNVTVDQIRTMQQRLTTRPTLGEKRAIIIDPADAEPVSADRDHVVVLSDWSDNAPEDIFATLKKVSHYYNMNERTLFDLLRDIREKGVRQTFQDRKMWNLMRMSDSDLSDVTGYTYSFLMNGHTPDANWHAPYRKGERVRLRFINASAMTFFDVRIPGLKLTAVAADGQPIHPVTMDEFRLSVAETLDVIVTPEDDNAYSIFCQAIDRSGFAAGTLSSAAGVVATRPSLDPVPVLGHREMGMGHGGHGDSGHDGMDHDAMNHGEMDHGSMNHDAMNHAEMNHSTMDHASMDHGQMNHAGMQHGNGAANPDLAVRNNVTDHLASEYGPGVDMRAEMPQRMLDDPGIGLRNNGRKVLTYADMRSLHQPDTPHAERDITLHLTGNMSRYMWSFNGIKFADAQPLHLRYGERVRINLVNDTMMHHPIHLHGMWSDIELGDGQLLRKHTVSVKPGEMLSYLVRADALGRWAFHCHLLYHMEAGMFREVRVSKEGR